MATIWFAGPLRGVLAALLLLLCAVPTSAQTRLYILFSGDGPLCPPTDCEPPRVVEIDVDGRRLLANTPVLHARQNATGPVVTPDGQYLAWMGTESAMTAASYLSVFDTATRWQTPLVRTSVQGMPGSLFADPTTVRLFSQFQYDSPMTVIEPQLTRGMAAPCTGATLTGLSGNGARLFVGCTPATPAAAQMIVLDSTTGVAVGTAPELGSFSAADDDGAHYFSASWGPAGYGVVLSRYDIATGQLLARREISGSYPTGPLVFDARDGRLYLGVSGLAAGIQVYDGQTFADVGRLPPPMLDARPTVVLDPDRALAYAVWTSFAAGPLRNRIMVYETAAFTVLAESNLANDTRVVGMALGPRPPRATNLAANVTGSTVTLEWTNQTSRSIATSLVVEAGSMPGLSDLARLSVPQGQTTLTVTDVPSGRYHVRVRSLNGTGLGDPSNEVVVVVR